MQTMQPFHGPDNLQWALTPPADLVTFGQTFKQDDLDLKSFVNYLPGMVGDNQARQRPSLHSRKRTADAIESATVWPTQVEWSYLSLAQKFSCLETWLDDALCHQPDAGAIDQQDVAKAQSKEEHFVEGEDSVPIPTNQMELDLDSFINEIMLETRNESAYLCNRNGGRVELYDDRALEDYTALCEADEPRESISPTKPERCKKVRVEGCSRPRGSRQKSTESISENSDSASRQVDDSQDKRARSRAASMRFRQRDKERRDTLKQQLEAALQKQKRLAETLATFEAKNRLLQQLFLGNCDVDELKPPSINKPEC